MGLVKKVTDASGNESWLCLNCGAKYKERDDMVSHLVQNHRDEILLELKYLNKKFNPSSRTGYDVGSENF